MKAVRFRGPNDVILVEAEKPMAKQDVSVVKVLSSGICCTDIEILSGLIM
jgi:threonine dehydrogenase-like Zn-dependent dehydrogenase